MPSLMVQSPPSTSALSKIRFQANNNWKTEYQKAGKETVLQYWSADLLSDALLKKTRYIIVESRLTGTVITRRMVIAIGTGVVKANDPNLLKKCISFIIGCMYVEK